VTKQRDSAGAIFLKMDRGKENEKLSFSRRNGYILGVCILAK